MLVCSCIYPMQLCVCSRGKFEQAASCKPQTWYPRTSGHSHLLSPKTAQYPTIECWWFKEPHREACRPQTPICAGWWQCHNNDYSIVDVFFLLRCSAFIHLLGLSEHVKPFLQDQRVYRRDSEIYGLEPWHCWTDRLSQEWCLLAEPPGNRFSWGLPLGTWPQDADKGVWIR